ncbi:MAG: rhodanese-like domain-containing protein [Proteobacteria bacterium]|nr:rhodanese-like domain-containing protein [Pseudomonadota bacterium]
MNTLTCLETLRHVFDFGVVIEVVQNLKENRLEMDFFEFVKHLFFGKGYQELTPPQLTARIKKNAAIPHIVDLREAKNFEKSGIQGAVSHPFDDLLRSILVDQKYTEYHEKEIVLACDTGQKSRVAASILAEEGFKNIYNLKGGMRRWQRWQQLLNLDLNLKCRQLYGRGLN